MSHSSRTSWRHFSGELGGITGRTTRELFIAFEGGEGSGKSTQTEFFKKVLKRTLVKTVCDHTGTWWNRAR